MKRVFADLVVPLLRKEALRFLPEAAFLCLRIVSVRFVLEAMFPPKVDIDAVSYQNGITKSIEWRS